MSQAQLAAATRVSQQQISNWERGISAPRDKKRLLIGRILGVPVEDLFAWPDDTNGDEAAA